MCVAYLYPVLRIAKTSATPEKKGEMGVGDGFGGCIRSAERVQTVCKIHFLIVLYRLVCYVIHDNVCYSVR